ncbi:MAG: type II toxin-antitoxin system VapC family toxin [Nitrospirales bacterium]
MIVVDASALVEQLLATPKGLKLHQRCLIAGESLHAPHLLDLEVVNVLRRYWQRDILSISRADQALEDLLVFPLTRYAHEMFLPRIWELRDNMTPYDAAYVALAESLKAPLVTCDVRLRNSPGHAAIIEVF